jgi:hypothetical protein
MAVILIPILSFVNMYLLQSEQCARPAWQLAMTPHLASHPRLHRIAAALRYCAGWLLCGLFPLIAAMRSAFKLTARSTMMPQRPYYSLYVTV